MRFADRLLTIAATATLTSAAWIVFGGDLLRQTPVAQGLASDPVEVNVERTGLSASVRNPAVQGTSPGGLAIPVEGVTAAQLADTYAQSRAGGSRLHKAIDIIAPSGTPVIAAAAGTIEKLFMSEDGGKTIYIRLPDRRTINYYAHLDDYSPTLREGASVRRGEVLGTVGTTGNAAPGAPHLHFAVMQTEPDRTWYEPSTAVNPYPLLTGR